MLSARLAVAGEMPAIQAITDASYAEYVATLGQKPLPMTEDYAPHIAAGNAWMVSRDGDDIGVIVVEREADHLLIFSLAVLPTARGGVGRWMLDFVDDLARQAGLAEVRLYTNALMSRNIAVYEKFGYRITGRRPNLRRPGWTFVDMAKQIL